MLIAKPTRYGSGITLYGDYWDLRNLRETIYFLTDASPLNEYHKEHLLGLAYDVRKAHDDMRKKETFGRDELSQVTYYGVDILWPVFLTQLAMLRKSAAYVPTNNEHQSNIFRLEACAEESLREFDLSVGNKCIELLKVLSNFWGSVLIEFIYHCTLRYVTETRPGKSRFKKLPEYLKMIDPFSGEYKTFEKGIQKIAQEKKCIPEELADWGEWPDFKW